MTSLIAFGCFAVPQSHLRVLGAFNCHGRYSYLSLICLLQKMHLLIIALLLAGFGQCNAFVVQRGIGLQAAARFAPFRVHKPLFAASMEELREDGDKRMQKSVENLKLQLGTIRAGKATYV